MDENVFKRRHPMSERERERERDLQGIEDYAMQVESMRF
jgi:hypothetical protein